MSSYYTGFRDLDDQLRILYNRQGELEAEIYRGNKTDVIIKEFEEVIRKQDALLFKGRMYKI